MKGSNKGGKGSSYDTWDKKYKALCRFKSLHGHCNVPGTGKYSALNAWVYRQKRLKSGRFRQCVQLSDDKILLLDAIDFPWHDNSSQTTRKPEKSARTISKSPPKTLKSPPTASRRSTRRSSTKARSASFQNERGPSDDSGFACQVFWMDPSSNKTNDIGIILMPSRADATFADARNLITADCGPAMMYAANNNEDDDWVFFLPVLGPVSKKQEVSLGSVWKLLEKIDPLGNFTNEGDAKIFVTKRDPVVA